MRTKINARHQRLKTTMIHVMNDHPFTKSRGEHALECLAPPPAHLAA